MTGFEMSDIQGSFDKYIFWAYFHKEENLWRVYIKDPKKNHTWGGIDYVNFKRVPAKFNDLPVHACDYIERYLRAYVMR